MPRYLSNRVKRVSQDQLNVDRYRYLSLNTTEPNLGDPSLTTPPSLPVGPQYQLISIVGYPGQRYWIPVGGGLIPGAISIFDEGNLTPLGGISSITQLNFVGLAVSAQGYSNFDGSPGTGVTITVFSPGKNGELLFNSSNDFGTSSNLTYNSTTNELSINGQVSVGIGGTILKTTNDGFVGIGTTNPTQELDLNGDLRLRGTIYDYLNQPGTTSQILAKNAFGGLSWVSPETVKSGAGGTYTNVQYQGLTGALEGAPNFVFNPLNNRVGIGSTLPQQLLDVLGNSRFNGQTDILNLNVSGIATLRSVIVSTGATVNALLKTQDLEVVGFSTFGQVIRVNSGAYVRNIQLGISGVNIINTVTGNLILDSNSGTTVIDDALTVSNAVQINSTTQSVSKGTGALIIGGGVGIGKNLNVGESLIVEGTSTLKGVVSAENDVLPTISGVQYLGNSSLKWDRVYANTFVGDLLGNVDSAITATRLATARNFSISGDTNAPAVSFDGTADVNLVTTLSNTGVIAGTYGSATQVGIVTVDSKGRITGARNVNIDVSSATVSQSNAVRTISTATNAPFFPTFVDSNNATAAYENVFTDSGITYNPGVDLLSLTNLTVSGIATFNGNLTLGDATTDTVNFVSRVGSGLTPSTDGTFNLGGASNRWNNVYANNFVGTIIGNADTATFATRASYADNAGIATNLKGGIAYQIPYQSGPNSTLFIPNGTSTGQLLQYNTGSAPSWVSPSSLTVDRANYATNAGIATHLKGGLIGYLPYQSSADNTTFLPPGTSGYILQTNGSGAAPSWVSPVDFTVDRANYATNAGIATNLKGGIASQIPYQSSPNTTAFIPNGTAGQLLQSNGTLAPSWVSPVGLTVDRANYATNAGIATHLKGGTAYQIPYQSSPNTTAFIPDGTVTGQLLQYNVGAAPSWVSPTNLIAGTAAQADTIKTQSIATAASFFPTFVDSNNGTAAYESLYTDAGITYNPSTNLLTVPNLNATGTTTLSNLNTTGNATFGGNVTFGNSPSDTITIIGSIVGAASSLVVKADNANTNRFLILSSTSTNNGITSALVDSNNSITYNPNSNLLSVTNLTASGTATFNGNVALGNNLTDTVTFTARVNSSILPSTTGTFNLGSTTNEWNNVYANNFIGSFSGTATSASAINISATSSTDTLTSIVLVANQTATSQSPFIDAGLTYNANTNVLNATVSTANAANTILSQSTATNAAFFPTFVDSNNGTAAYESLYTDAGITYNPSSNVLQVSGDIRAPIFYDSDNTMYYCNPTGISVFWTLNVNNNVSCTDLYASTFYQRDFPQWYVNPALDSVLLNAYISNIYSTGTYTTTTTSAAQVRINTSAPYRLARFSSSIKYKKDVETLEDFYADNFLDNARPVWYRSKCEMDNPDYGFYGFIAEELSKFEPRLVVFGENMEPEGVHYEVITSILTNIAQRQKKQIESQQSIIEDLVKRIEALESK